MVLSIVFCYEIQISLPIALELKFLFVVGL